MSDKASEIIKACNTTFNGTERANQSHMWQDLSKFIMPSQSGVFLGEDTPGAKKTEGIYDTTAIQANQDLAAAIHSTLTNPATMWSRLRFKSDELNNNREATAWLEGANKAIHSNYNESNFDTQVSKNYQMFTSLGNMILFQEEVSDNNGQFEKFRFNAIHLAEVAFSENMDGQADCVYRKFKLTARQLQERWANKLPEEVSREIEIDPDARHDVVLCVCPRKKEEVQLNPAGLAPATSRPYASYYVLVKTKTVLEEGGYYEFPFYITRWQTMPNEVYGRGPGHIGLPGIKTLNKLDELDLKSAAKAVNPPMMATQGAVLSSLDLGPGRLSIVRDIDGIREFNTNARFDVTQLKSEDLKSEIKSIFFIDKLFLPPRTETGEMTAFEIDQRLAQMQRVLGPTLSRLNNEFLNPLIIRSFRMLLRAGQLPELPDILKEQGIDVEINFVNQLSRAQQIEELGVVQAWVQDVGGLAQFNPGVLDLINFDAVAKFSANIRGISETLVTNDKEVEGTREARAQQQQEAAALEQGVAVADINSKTQ